MKKKYLGDMEIQMGLELSFISTSVILMLLIIKKWSGDIMWYDILINIGCAVLSSIAVSSFIYYKYFRRIPEETKKCVDEILNKRLQHETTNHNFVMQALNPDNGKLSLEHMEIRNTVNSLNTAVSVQLDKMKADYSLLSEEQKDIYDSVEKIKKITVIMSEINRRNRELAAENERLKIKLETYQTQNIRHTKIKL